MPDDFSIRTHREWLGYVQPMGVVVSATALEAAGVAINQNSLPLHREFLRICETNPTFRDFAIQFFGWQPTDLQTPPESFMRVVPGYDEVLHPTYVVQDGETTLMLVQELTVETTTAELDNEIKSEANRWKASPEMRFERLLRETNVPAGLLVFPGGIRLAYAPKGESSGHITFSIPDMKLVAGRPILAALHMLLSTDRLFTGPKEQRLPAILIASRKHQNQVSTKLAVQVMEALFELLRGFQPVLRDEPNWAHKDIYPALLTVLLRLVFLLYAEDRGLLSSEPLYVNHYSVNGLFESLREDFGRHSDTMDSRYGAWARLLALFRMIYCGARHGKFRIPGRKGYLFDPERFLFLKGNAVLPRVPDGAIYRVLEKLLILDGERLSYRSLDVEQIGSVYEASMGFELQIASGSSIAIKAKKKTGAPVTVNLEELLRQAPANRNEWLGKQTDQKLTGVAERDLKTAVTIDDAMVVLDRKIAKNVTRDRVSVGSLIFQPSPERRRSGSHYTPRSLTSPIVRDTLEPVLRQLGTNPKLEQILGLKVCDPAMGSGAFLVAACRQLGDSLVASWHTHKTTPPIPLDEDEVLHAQRMVAQRCLYGVDKNEMAVDLAKLSLWLATLARDHEFTFLNHALRHGDSLLGLSARQIAAFHWESGPQSLFEGLVRKKMVEATGFRRKILDARDDASYEALAYELARADDHLEYPRLYGDLVLSAFFTSGNKARRKAELQRLTALRAASEEGEFRQIVQEMRTGEKALVPFHWEIEFPEVFRLDANLYVQGGFDAVISNPPFAGKNTLIEGHADGYLDWLKTLDAESHGNSDLVAHFFRRAFDLLRPCGCFGLIATNSIGQGDTRSTGLRWICTHGGTIYRARKRRQWPGEAAVIVSVVNICVGSPVEEYSLDGRHVSQITAYLFHAGGNEDPECMSENAKVAFEGVKIYGSGFLFDNSATTGHTTPLTEMKSLIAAEERNRERIQPYIGGEEFNGSPTLSHSRFVINFENWPLRRFALDPPWSKTGDHRNRYLRQGIVPLDYPNPVAADWPDLLGIVEEKVLPQRKTDNRENYRRLWWQFGERRPGLMSTLAAGLERFLVCSRVSDSYAFGFLSGSIIPSDRLSVFALPEYAAFTALQGRTHEVWARFFGSTLKDDLMYVPSKCFETYPFPEDYRKNREMEEIGHAYYDLRADLMIRNNEGLTKTYNRFHNPNERSVDNKKLRGLHDQMDQTVLDAYGWSDIRPVCDFFPEFEEEDEEVDEQGARRPRVKKYRYRWPDEVHDEVLARLLALNQERAAQGR